MSKYKDYMDSNPKIRSSRVGRVIQKMGGGASKTLTLKGRHKGDLPRGKFEDLKKYSPISRYDSGGVHGKNTYMDVTGNFTTLDRNSMINQISGDDMYGVEAKVKNPFIVTPDNQPKLNGSSLEDLAKSRGHDSIVIEGFEELGDATEWAGKNESKFKKAPRTTWGDSVEFGLSGKINPEMYQDQVVLFDAHKQASANKLAKKPMVRSFRTPYADSDPVRSYNMEAIDAPDLERQRVTNFSSKDAMKMVNKHSDKARMLRKIGRSIPLVGTALGLLTSDDVSAGLDPLGSDIIGGDEAIENPGSLPYQERMNKLRLEKAITNRRTRINERMNKGQYE